MQESLSLIPFIGEWQQGRDYDFATAADTLHRGSLTRNPIEDGQLSYVNDHNRDDPIQITGIFAVSTAISTGPNKGRIDVLRPGRFYRELLDLRAKQVVDPTAMLTIYTGTIVVPSMAIIAVQENRQARRNPQKPEYLVTFEEVRFADQPIRLDLGPQPVGAQFGNGILAQQDRAILEGVRARRVRGTNVSILGTPGTEFQPVQTTPSSLLSQLLSIF